MADTDPQALWPGTRENLQRSGPRANPLGRSAMLAAVASGWCVCHRTPAVPPLGLAAGAAVNFGRKGKFIVDDRLKELMQELGNAINESLSDSERIAAAISEIKQAGYDVFLVLEATIGFNKRDEDEDASDEDVSPEQFEAASTVKWTSQDHKFLRALKISVDEESQ